MGTGVRHIDRYKTEYLLANSAGNTTTLWIDMALYSHVTFFVLAVTAATPTGGAITINQATDTLGTGSKALAYNNHFSATGGFAAQTSASDVWAQTTGDAGTFTSGNTANTNYAYAIEIQDTDLDLNNLFKTVQVSISNAAVNTGFTVVAHCFPRFDGKFDALPSALT